MEQSPHARVLAVAPRAFREPIGGMLKRAGCTVLWVDDLSSAGQVLEGSAFDLVVVHGPLLAPSSLERVRDPAREGGLPLPALGGSSAPGVGRPAPVDRTQASPMDSVFGPAEILVTAGELALDVTRHTVAVGECSLELTPLEFELLHRLARRPGWVLSRRQLLEQVWGYEYGDPRVVTVHIGNLRRKLARVRPGHTYIETVRGVGYRLAVCGVEAASGTGRPRSGAESVVESSERRTRPAFGADRPPFVGREAEMAALSRLVSAARAGRVRVVGIAGEAGIGKTRLAEELSTSAAQEGFAVYWGHCCEDRAGPVYGPWLEVLQNRQRDTRERYVERVFGPSAGDRGHSGRGADGSRVRLLRDLAEVVRDWAGDTAVCLIFEDLHWADTHSLLALQYVMRHLHGVPLLLVLTYRPSERPLGSGAHRLLTDVVAEIAHSDGGFVLPLAPFSRKEVERFVRGFQLAGTVSPPPGLSTEAYRQAEGNPFFLTQFMRLVGVGHAPGVPCLRWDEGVRSVVLHRFLHLSASCRLWLEGAALCGRDFNASVAAKVTGLDPASLQELLAEAGGAGLIVTEGGLADRCRFDHSLTQQVLQDEIAPDTRIKIKAALVGIGGGGASNDMMTTLDTASEDEARPEV